MDYNHPQDWFDNLSVCAQAGVGKGNDGGYCNPALDTLVSGADAKPLDQALPDYLKATKILVDDVVWVNLVYGADPFMTQKWVTGVSYNGFYDTEWKGISIIKH